MQQNQIMKNYNIESPSVKELILQYLQHSNATLNLRPEYISGNQDLVHIRDNGYIICPRSTGVRSWIIFFKDDNKYYAVNFPKHHPRRKDQINIYPIEIPAASDFYLGTVMEGIYYRDETARYLAIDEVYTLAGENQLLRRKSDRLDNLANFFKINLQVSRSFYMFPTRYYTPDVIGLTQLFQEIKNESRIQEIIFYPQLHGDRVFNYTINDSDRLDDVVRLAEYYMIPTSNTDVYKLLTIEDREKIGIAHIPSIEISQKCKSWFKGSGRKKIKEIRVLCESRSDTCTSNPYSFDPNEKRKWIPIKIVEDSDTETEDDIESETPTK